MSESSAAALRLLPSIDELLRSDAGVRFIEQEGSVAATISARRVVDELRRQVADAGAASGGKTDLLLRAARALDEILTRESSSGLRRVINATGVIIHTNLGRAPLPDAAKRALLDAAGYATLEYDISTGRRGRRGARAESLVAELAGAEDAVIVNNGAAAAFIALSALAAGGEVVISRGELVEIGGDFRVPDVLAASGASLKEVGTTNRTKVADYERAITERTRMILRVHPSNFRIVGFTAAPSRVDLTALTHERGLVFFEDLGSGALLDLSASGLDEPVVADAIRDGADIVSFSGDKLLGGPQAGVIAGRSDLVERIRKDPMYRVLRCDKLILAAVESVLLEYRRGLAVDKVPVLKQIFAGADEIHARAKGVIDQLNGAEGLSAEINDGFSAVGGGAAPGVEIPTKLIAIRHSTCSADRLEERLRGNDPPVITRIENGLVLLDLRTVSEDDESTLITAIHRLSE